MIRIAVLLAACACMVLVDPTPAEAARKARFRINTLKVSMNKGYNTARNRSRVKRAARSRIMGLKHCYVMVLKKNPKYDGWLWISARMNSRGKVISVNVQSTLSNRAAKNCLSGGVKFWHMPERAAGQVNAQVRVRGR